MTKVRFGVIGLGNIGALHCSYLKADKVADAQLTAVCDIKPEKLRWAKDTLGDEIRRFASAEEMYASGAIDAAIIATPHYDHPPLAIQAFKHGLHVLTEKPAGVYTRQVREMNEAAAKSGKVFGIMFQSRTIGVFQKIRELIQSGELGEIRRIAWIKTDWYRPEVYYRSGGWRATWAGEGGGVLMNQCPHTLDLWQWMFGLPKRVRAACAFGKYHDIEVEDDVTASMEYANGATATFITTTGEAPGSDHLEIAGDRGLLVFANGQLTFRRTRVPVSQHLKECRDTFGSPECWTIPIAAPNHSPTGAGHSDVTFSFVRGILKGLPLVAPGEDGIKGLELANAMLLSAWTGQGWIDLPVNADFYYAKLKEKIDTSTFRKSTEESRAVDMTKSFR